MVRAKGPCPAAAIQTNVPATSPSQQYPPLTSCWLATLLLGPLCLAIPTADAADHLRLLVARSANESGLISKLAASFSSDHRGVQVQIIDAGTLTTLERGRAGAGDAIVTHVPDAERLFMADGYGASRTLFMYNQLAVFGPPEDPLHLRGETNLLDALRRIANAEPPFLVQGERSGTAYRLLQLWATARIRPAWLGYETTQGGSLATLGTAAEFGAYAFADMSSYFSLPPKRRAQLAPLVRDHRALRNDFHYIVVNPDKVAGANAALANEFLAFLVSDRGQQIIGQFRPGQAPVALFTPAAHLDPDLAVRRHQAQLDRQRHQLYLLSAAVGVALALSLLGLFIYRRARAITRAAMRHVARIERAVAGSELGLFEWDLRAGSLYWTDKTLELLRLDASDARNLHALLRQALDNSEANRVSMALQQAVAVADGKPVRIVFRSHGRRMALRGHAERDADGNPIRFAGVLILLPDDDSRPPQLDEGLRDTLTGLPNRQLLTDRLQHALSQCARTQTPCMVLMISINAVRAAESLSDAAPSDDVVRAVAARLRQLLRASDTIARVEHTTFAAVLPSTDQDHCRQAVEKLLAGLDRPFHVQHRSVHVDGAIGCAMYPDHGDHHHTLLQRAQLAMLQATRDSESLVIYHALGDPSRPQTPDDQT